MKYQTREWLRGIRIDRGLSEKEVARRAGIGYKEYDHIEHGRRGAKGTTGFKISRVLGFDMALFYVDEVCKEDKKEA